VSVEWSRATGPASGDGSLLLSVGNLSSEVSGIQNDLSRIDGIQVGFLGGLGLQSDGSVYLDDFSSQWATPIPVPTETPTPPPSSTPTSSPTTPTPDVTATPCSTHAPFTDNGDGTVSDSCGLMWEKKTGVPGGGPNPSDPHDVNNGYSWTAADLTPWPFNGTAKTVFLDRLNCQGAYTSGCTPWLGYTDWRLPTIEEFSGRSDGGTGTGGIVDLTRPGCGDPYSNYFTPCINPIFGPTRSNLYWSSSIYDNSPDSGWSVNFNIGEVSNSAKTLSYYVRAVRGGSRERTP